MRADFSRSRQDGFALVAAIFLLVVIAALGAFAVQINMSQRSTADAALMNARAHAAAKAGLEYAAARVLAAQNCGALPLNQAAPLVHGFSFTMTNCTPLNPAPVVNGVPVNIFTVVIVASRGTYGTSEFVSRRITARITN